MTERTPINRGSVNMYSTLLDSDNGEMEPATNLRPRRRTLTGSMDWRDQRNGSVSDNFMTSKEDVDGEDALNTDLQSLDYDLCENTIYELEEKANRSTFQVRKIEVLRWIVVMLIGLATGLTAFLIDISIEHLSDVKYQLLKAVMDFCINNNNLYVLCLVWIAVNSACVFCAGILVAFVEPVAAGSGIPQIKCFLNGIKIPHVVRLKTLLCKTVGVVFSVVGGLAVGKEGPMIHSGAVVAAGISQGRATSFKLDLGIFVWFRNDKEKRDFVSAGAAAGVAAAFGAPVGGVLFALEEGASFWNQRLTWRIFFSSLCSVFALSLLKGAVDNKLGDYSQAGLISFGQFTEFPYQLWELAFFCLMGVAGALLGALFVQINYYVTRFRMRYITTKVMRLFEVLVVGGLLTTILAYVLVSSDRDCQPLGKDPMRYPVQMACADGEFNSMTSLIFQTPESAVKSLFHDSTETYKLKTLVVFFPVWFFVACVTYGIFVPSGLFIPLLLIGAAWGRAVGLLLYMADLIPASSVGQYALIGAACQLGGVVRMTISLTVIIMEATGNIAVGLPIMIVLMLAKFLGDLFNEGIYDMHIHMNSVPLLPWEPPSISAAITAREVMSHPVTTFRVIEQVGQIVTVLKNQPHDGFPVITGTRVNKAGGSFGTLRGLITRQQLIVILSHKVFKPSPGAPNPQPKTVLTMDDFRRVYPRYPSIEEISNDLAEDELEMYVNLQPYMNPAPYSAYNTMSMMRIFHLFRGLGLRHLVIINEENSVVGMVTRKDLARWEEEKVFGEAEEKIRELQFSTRVDHH